MKKKKLKSSLPTPGSQKRLVKSSQSNSQQQRLALQKLGREVSLHISPELQSQITYMCQKVWNDEWSGMLFYETEGNFGEENFKMTAKALFPLDIGTATYTEYDPADPALIQFLIDNPEMLSLKKGHIHSHNNMGVFFSTTDDEELIDNCQFHNFYLSLIVNNRNEMCAKIAFKAKTSSVTDVTVTFLDENGKEKSKKMTTNKEVDMVYYYTCNISAQEKVEDSFKSRFLELTKKKKEEEESVKKASKADPQVVRSKDWINGESWRQGGLFENNRGTTTVSKKKEEPSLRTPWGGAGVSRTDPRIHSMLCKMVAQDHLYEGSLYSILQKKSSELFPGVEKEDHISINYYFERFEKSVLDYYMDAFPEDSYKLVLFDSVMEACEGILDRYVDDFPEMVTGLIESIN